MTAMRINIAAIRRGDLFWECDRLQGNVQFEAMADAVTYEGRVTLQARNVQTGEPQAFLETIGSPYGLSLYSEPAYANVPGGPYFPRKP